MTAIQETPRRFLSRRGRPNAEEAARLTALIVEIGRDLFLSQGYEDASMDAVAHRAAVSKGTLYARFPNKADLFRAVVEDQVERWSRASTEAAPTPPGTPLDTALRLYGGSILTAACSPESRALERMMTSVGERFPELRDQFEGQAIEHGIALVAELLGRQDGDHPSPRNPQASAKAFIAMVLGWTRGGGDRDDLAARMLYVEHCVAIFLQGRAKW